MTARLKRAATWLFVGLFCTLVAAIITIMIWTDPWMLGVLVLVLGFFWGLHVLINGVSR